MKTIGITGGVGAGKSAVLDYIATLDSTFVLKADEAAKEIRKKGEECYNNIVEAFGTGILDSEGNIDNERFATVIFSDKKNLNKADSIIHPAVKKRILEIIEEQRRNNVSFFILEAALLIEDGYKEILDEIWLVSAPQEVRRTRLKLSRGYSDEKIDSIMKNQMNEDEFIANCDRVLVNDGNIEEVYRQIDKMLI